MNAREQVAAYRRLFDLARTSNQSARDFLRPDLENARVRLGTSVADYSLPYVLHPDLAAIIDRAMKELAYLFIYRNQKALGEESDAFLMMDHGMTADLRPRSYSPPPTLKNQALRTLLLDAPRHMFLLDCGIMESWLGGNGRGRYLMEAWSRFYSEAADEMLKDGGGEETPYFLSFALINACSGAAKVAEELPVEAQTKKLTATVLLLGLHLVHHFVKSQLMTLKTAQIPAGSRLPVCLDSLLNPQTAFLAAPNLYDLCTFYNVPASLLGEKRVELMKKLGGADFSAFEKGIDEIFEGSGKLKKEAFRLYQTAAYRRTMLEVLGAGLPLDSKLFTLIEGWFLKPESLEETLKAGKVTKEVVSLMKAMAKEKKDNVPLAKKLDELATLFKRYSNFRPLKTVQMKPEDALKEIRADIAADLGDTYLSTIIKEVLNRFRPKSGSESDRDLAVQYDAGQLYRFGSEPILKKAVPKINLAHYFIDLKDYTERTALFKEEVMGHFIREEFYEPILRIAKSKFQGLSHMEDRGGIYLNNLLGDAVSISGSVVAIVEMTRQIRRHLEQYAMLLEKRQTREDLAERAEEIKGRYGLQMKDTSAKLEALQTAGGQAGDKLLELNARMSALKGDMEIELDQLTGQHLISGSFISFGAAANVITFNDTLWGDMKVSICEKINESARGTSRPNSIIAAINQLLEIEKRRLQRPELKLPFELYVGNSIGLPLAPEVGLALRHAFAGGKAQEAYKLYVQSAQVHIKKTLAGGRPGIRRYLQGGMAIYNAGDGLTGEALDAYREAYANIKFVDVNLPIRELEETIRGQFAFFKQAIRLVVGVNANRQISQLFHYAGAVTFKGFESAPPTEVWEIIDMQKAFGEMMAESAALFRVVEKASAG